MPGLPPPHEGVIAVPKPIRRPSLSLNVWRVNVLVVEDDEADADLIVHALKQHPDVGAVETRNDPDKALRELKAGRLIPTIILLDIHMPRLDGFEFVDRLRQIPPMRNVPVVFLTTSRLVRDVEEARRSSACGYLVKPERFEELQSSIDRVIKQAIAGNRRK
jgi:CheY-like chemotaxis protein